MDPSWSLLSFALSSGDISCRGSHQGLVTGDSSCCPSTAAPIFPCSHPCSASVRFSNSLFKVSLKNQTLPGRRHWRQRGVCDSSGPCPQGVRRDWGNLSVLVALPSWAPAPAAQDVPGCAEDVRILPVLIPNNHGKPSCAKPELLSMEPFYPGYVLPVKSQIKFFLGVLWELGSIAVPWNPESELQQGL